MYNRAFGVRHFLRNPIVKLLKNKWFVVGLIVILVVIFAAFALNRKDKPQYFTAAVERGDVRQVVEATGTINAVTTVQVGSQVSGTIWKLFADFNSHVTKGQLVARIEPSLFEGAVLQAQADLENARANYAAAKANLEKAKATAVQARADFQRTQGLAKQGVMSQQQLDLAQANADSADAQVSAGDATVKQAAAQVQQRQAALEVAKTNLQHSYIYAPIDGTVINRAVDVGQTVAASFQAPTLFTIAQDLTKMQVYAKTDESDIGQIHPGQKVTFRVDAFPKDTFEGAVTQVRMNPTTVQNVVTYDTVVDFANPELKLFPGMTAYVSIPVAVAKDTLKVPNGALRYKPEMKPEEMRALLQKYGIESGGEQRQDGQQGQGGTQMAQASRPSGDGEAGAARSGGASGQRFRMDRGGENPGGGAQRSNRLQQQLDHALVWKLGPDHQLIPVQLQIGITDHTTTQVVQVLKGEVKEGDKLVTGATVTRGASRGPGPMGGGPGGPRR